MPRKSSTIECRQGVRVSDLGRTRGEPMPCVGVLGLVSGVGRW
jgi:hypothetical protein